MPTESEDSLQSFPSSECPESSRGAFARLRTGQETEDLSSEEETGEDESASLRPSEDDRSLGEAKTEDQAGLPTPPPSEPESDRNAPGWRRSDQSAHGEARREARHEDEERHGESSKAVDILRQPSPQTTLDSDSGLARSMSSASISPSPPPAQYLYFPELEANRHEKATTSFLRPGSKFVGTQTSDRQKYDVQVEIKDVDLEESFVCGYLRIQGLTDDHPTLTTFFEGEIIGPKYKFKTTHPSWGSSEKIDMTHWACFPDWRKLAKPYRSPNFTAPNHLQREQLYMRWKEYFLVPDHRVKTITGASFEGFYYISFNQCTGTVDGVYFHAKSEKWQQLRLEHVEDRGCVAAMEFR